MKWLLASRRLPLFFLLLAVPAFADLPATAEEHLTMAKTYRDKAAEYKKEVTLHQEMAKAYAKGMPGPAKSGAPNPWVAKMEKHCQEIAKDAAKLAADAEKAAEFHELRAKEVQAGK